MLGIVPQPSYISALTDRRKFHTLCIIKLTKPSKAVYKHPISEKLKNAFLNKQKIETNLHEILSISAIQIKIGKIVK